MRRRFLNNINKSSSGYFTIEALEDGLTAKLSVNDCKYRIDDGSWNTLSADSNTPTINKGQKIAFKITNPTILSYGGTGIGTFTISKKCNLKGNIMSMLYGDNFTGQNNLSRKYNVFCRLFYDCKNIVDVSELLLPATTLEENCYYEMFHSCTSLTTAPQLPATTLADGCYYKMFYYCSGLITAPELPATTLAKYCYSSMFYDCWSLPEAPQLPATTLTHSCYEQMFKGCSNLNYIKMLATDISAKYCLDGWVKGVASTGTFVKHKDMVSLPSGVDGIPKGWTVEDYIEPVHGGGN